MDCIEVSWIFNQLILATRFDVPDYIVRFYSDMLLDVESYGSLRELQEAYRTKHNEILAKQTASRYVDYLEQAGWVAKEPDPIDKRRMMITPLIKESLPVYEAGFPENFTPESLQQWIQDLEDSTKDSIILQQADLQLPGAFVHINEEVDPKRLNIFDTSGYTLQFPVSPSQTAESPGGPLPGEYLCPYCRAGLTKTLGWEVRAVRHLRDSHGTQTDIERYQREIREAAGPQ